MLKINEVYLKTIKEYEENSDGSTKMVSRKAYRLRESLINPEYIVAAYYHEFTASSDLEKLDQLPEGTKFCRLVLDGNSFRSSEIIVEGSFSKLDGILG